MLSNISGLYRKTMDHRLSLSYRGPFVEKLTADILQFSENAMLTGQGTSMLNRKVSYLLVECFQNVIRHGENMSKSSDGDDGLFCFRNQGGLYIINSINRIRCGDLQDLGTTVEMLNTLSGEDLKKAYLYQLVNGGLSDKGGAGLGLIELARKSGQKLLYKFERISDDLALFHQQVSLAPGTLDKNPPDLIQETSLMYQEMIEDKKMLQYKGDFSQKTLLPILKIVENSCADNLAFGKCRRVGHAVVEVLQNISKHALKSNDTCPGVFVIGRDEDSIFIQAGNSIDPSEQYFLKEKLDYLATLDVEGLKELHKKAIRSSIRFENKNRAGLGLIEVARVSMAKMKYAFEETGANQMFFSLQVNI